MFLLVRILRELFSIDYLVANILLYSFDMTRSVKQSYQIWKGGIGKGIQGRENIFRTRKYLGGEFIVHYEILFEHYTITALVDNERVSVLLIPHRLLTNMKFAKILLIRDIIKSPNNPLLVKEHSIDIIGKGYGRMYVNSERRSIPLSLSTLVLHFHDHLVEHNSWLYFSVVVVGLGGEV